jgi:hypothetical protein
MGEQKKIYLQIAVVKPSKETIYDLCYRHYQTKMLTLQSKVNEKAECSNINIGLRGNFYSGFRAYWVYVMKLLFHEDMNLSI